MNFKTVKKNLFFFACQLLLIGYSNRVTAQKIQYSGENIFINNPDHLQLVANIAGNHHLLSIVDNENPVLFVFNRELALEAKIRLPFRFPERSEIRIIRFDNFYYFYLHPRLSQEYLFWKIDRDGNLTDFTTSFQKLLQSQSQNIKLSFQLVVNQKELCMVYHTSLTDPEKSTLVMVQTDSLLNIVFSHKVVYDFKRDEEKVQQETLMFGRYLLVLKTARSGTSLELMKVNLATGYTIRNTFYSSGYFYSQSAFSYNMTDSSVTVSSLLTEPRVSGKPKRFVFVSRLNKILIERAPFAVLKTQFSKNTNTNFLLVDGLSKWIRLRAEREQTYNTGFDNTNNVALYQDLTMPDINYQNTADNNRLLSRTTQVKYNSFSDFPEQGIRFSLLDKNFKIASDSLVPNTKDSYTIRADQFTRFAVNSNEYMLVGQLFLKKNRGLLMINANDAHQLVFTDIRVNDRNDYLLSKAQIIPREGVILPYIRGREAGLIKITIE